MTESLRESVEAAFDTDTRAAFGDTYLERVYSNWSDAVRALRRAFFLLIVLVLGFIILDHAQSAEVDLGPLQISDISAVLILIPSMASFLLFEALDLMLADHYYKEAASATVKVMHPSIYKHNLELLLEPTTSFALGMGPTSDLKPERPGRLNDLRGWCEAGIAIGVVLGTLGFFLLAFASLFHGPASVLAVTASLLFTVFNLLRCALTLLVAWPDLNI